MNRAEMLFATETMTDDKINLWLKKLAKENKELSLIAPENGTPFNDNKMWSLKPIVSPADAIVEEIICYGIESNNEILLEAIVIAKDTRDKF